jgi:hypothetical protein
MIEKIGPIKTPLTIIAIFAGISEVCGTVVLPFIDADNQFVFIVFLIAFPTLLVILFFLTLNLNNKVLYAPSDYEDEENFVTLTKYDYSNLKLVEEKIDSNEILFSNLDINEEIKNLNYKVNRIEEILISESDSEIYIENNISKYKILISPFTDISDFMYEIEELGYNYEIYEDKKEENSTPKQNKCIWLGSRVPLSIAKEIINKATNHFDNLEYINISVNLV